MDTGNQMLYPTCVTFFNGTLVLLFNRKFVPCFSFFVFVLFCFARDRNTTRILMKTFICTGTEESLLA